jgi:hypothetical protein
MKTASSNELFSPTNGGGFQERAAQDGWTEENSASFKQLTLRAPDKTGKDTLRSLSQSKVDTIAPRRSARPFHPKTNANELLGQIRTSGIFFASREYRWHNPQNRPDRLTIMVVVTRGTSCRASPI